MNNKIELNWKAYRDHERYCVWSIKRWSYNDVDKSFLAVATKGLFVFQVFHLTFSNPAMPEIYPSSSQSPAQRPLCVVGKLRRKKKTARGERWEGEWEKRGSRLFPLPIVLGALSIFSIIAIYIGIPNGSLCGGESPSSVCSNLSRKEGKRRWFVKVSSLVRWWYK